MIYKWGINSGQTESGKSFSILLRCETLFQNNHAWRNKMCLALIVQRTRAIQWTPEVDPRPSFLFQFQSLCQLRWQCTTQRLLFRCRCHCQYQCRALCRRHATQLQLSWNSWRLSILRLSSFCVYVLCVCWMVFHQCFDAAGWATGRPFGLWNAVWWFVDGDDCAGALHVS